MIRKIILIACFFSVRMLFAQAPKELKPIVEIAGTDTNGLFGFYAAGVEDMNKDGYADFCVSAYKAKRTYLYYGGKNPSKIPAKTFLGGGKIVSGDFNGDGWRDLAIAYYLTDTVFVYYGGPNMDTIPDVVLHSNFYSSSGVEGFGYDGLQAGDINRDGYDDLLVGESQYPYDFSDMTKTFKGRISVYAGSLKGLDSSAVWSIVGDTAFSRLGLDIAIGDVNGDGEKDIVALGQNTLSSSSNDWYFYISVFTVDPSFQFKRNYYLDERNFNSAHYKNSVEFIACFDIDGDGIDDILIGGIYVFKGGAKLDTMPMYHILPPYNDTSSYGINPWPFGGGDYNKDGIKDLLLRSGQGGGAPGFRVYMGRKNDVPQFLAYRSFPASDINPLDGIPYNVGDVNGDGVDDIMMGTTSAGFPNGFGLIGIYSGDTSIVTEVKPIVGDKPNNFDLKQNYPNPFNPSTVISYQLSDRADVALKIFDEIGKEIVTLVNERQSAGEHSVRWDGKSSNGQQVSSGAYFYQLQINNKVVTKKAVLVK